MIMTAGMVTADEAYRTGLVRGTAGRTLEFCNGVAQKIMRNLWRSAKLSSQLMLIIKTVKMALRNKIFREMFWNSRF
jgi:enoyl-CoA hydratase/carnithine racemase